MKVNHNFLYTLTASLLLAAPNLLAATWQQMPAWQQGVNGPSAREHALIFITPNKPDELLVYGGLDYSAPQNALNDLWSMNLKTGSWRQVNQKGNSPGPGARLAIDEKSKTILVTGGDSAGLPSSNAYSFSYEKNVGAWTKVQTLISLSRSFHALVSVAGSDMFLAFGGISAAGRGQVLNNIATFLRIDSANGQKVLQEGAAGDTGAPAERYGFPYAYDKRNNRLVMSVGQGNMTADENGKVTSQQDDKTFAIDVAPETPVWKELTNAKLAPRRNPCWALDTSRNHLYVMGGTADGQNAIDELSRLDLNDLNPTWQKVSVAEKSPKPEARASCVGVYDKHRDRILFGFGNNAKGLTTDMWALQLK